MLLKIIDGKFPGRLPAELREMVNQQESAILLDQWAGAAIDVTEFEAVLAAFKR